MTFMKSFQKTLPTHSQAPSHPCLPLARLALLLLLTCATSIHLHAAASNSIARVWNERALAAIRADTPHPPAQARNYFSFSVCMYDAWAAYDPVAVGYVYRGKHTAANLPAARSNAISYAVFRMMKERHVYSRTAANTLLVDDNLMTSLGFDIHNNSRDTSTPPGVGNSVYDAVSAWFINDGARQANRKKSIHLRDIQSLPFVLLSEAHCLTDSVVSFCRQSSFQPLSVERTSQLAMVQELVALNHGISLVPQMARDLDTNERRVYRSLQGTKPMRSIVMVTNPYRYRSLLQRNFQESMRCVN